MRVKSVIFSAIFLAALATPVAAWDTSRSIVRIKSGLDGRTVIQSICAQLHCEILHSLDTLPGETGPSSLFVVRNLPAPSLTVNYDLLGIEAVEADLPARLAEDETWGVSQATAAVLDALADHTPATYYGATAWQSYLRQPASTIVRTSDTHCTLRATGGGVVAVVDTGDGGRTRSGDRGRARRFRLCRLRPRHHGGRRRAPRGAHRANHAIEGVRVGRDGLHVGHHPRHRLRRPERGQRPQHELQPADAGERARARARLRGQPPSDRGGFGGQGRPAG